MTETIGEAALTVYTTRWCGDCFRTKRYLNHYGVAYDEVDITDNAEARAYVEQVNGGYRSVPTIVFPSSRVIVEPSNRELHEVLVSEGLLEAAS